MNAAYRRGLVLVEQRRYAEAEKYFRDALAQDPNEAYALDMLALCLSQQQRYDEAVAAITRAIELEPETSHFHARKAFALANLNFLSSAMQSAKEALALEPESAYAHRAMAFVLLQRREWSKAETFAKKSLELDPQEFLAAEQLSYALRSQNRLQEAADHLASILSQDPEDSSIHIEVGWTSLRRGNYTKAEKHFLEALRLRANSSEARYGLKETLRARSPIYRTYLHCRFFLQQFTDNQRWLITATLLVTIPIAWFIFPRPIVLFTIGSLISFAMGTEIVHTIGNLPLLFDRTARKTLSKDEQREAGIVGGTILLGLPLVLIGAATGLPASTLAGTLFIGMAILAYGILSCSFIGCILYLYFYVAGLAAFAGAFCIIPISFLMILAITIAGILSIFLAWM